MRLMHFVWDVLYLNFQYLRLCKYTKNGKRKLKQDTENLNERGVCIFSINLHKFIFALTELIANISGLHVTGLMRFIVTIHVPQPPSMHIRFVPVKFKLFLKYVFKFVSGVTVEQSTNLLRQFFNYLLE